MSKSTKQPIDNAAEIIEKFGGIRPMSSKINVAVTTIQGWKKRGSIPASRKELLLQISAENNIDLSKFFDDAPAIVDIVKAEITEVKAETKEVVEVEKEEEEENIDKSTSANDFTEIAITTERKAITKSALIAASMVLLTLAAAIAMLWPNFEKFDKHGDRIAALEGEVSDIKNKQTSFKGLVPENWMKQLDELKEQVSQAKDSISGTVDKVKSISKELINSNGLEDRVVKLQGYVSEIANESGIFSLLSRFDGMEGSSNGQNILDSSVIEISSLMQSLKGKDDSYVNNALNVARSQSASLQETLGSVPQNELKAAAMLLALTQVRSALNRSDEAFDSDLGLLMNMVGEDNAELKNSLVKLTPHAKTGVLSAAGLQDEFKTIAGDVVAASLSGDDVSFTEKASARMNEILQIEKDGELLTGTETQVTVDKAGKMIQGGNLDAALKYLKSSLNADELEPLKPWLQKAEAVLTSRKVKKLVEQTIEFNVGRGFLGGSQLLNDDE